MQGKDIIDYSDNSLIIWNKQDRHDINALLAAFTNITVTLSDIGEVIAIITKTGEVPPTLYDDSNNLHELCEMQMQTALAFNSFGFSMKYHIRRRFYIIVQHTMRWLSPKFKSKLKSWIRKR